MARALIVGCGCRGRELAAGLLAEGWLVRGTTRDAGQLAEITAAGAEAVRADPDVIGSVLDHVADVTALFWLLGSAHGPDEQLVALHDMRLRRLLEELVDTPVRGIVYEAGGSVDREHRDAGVAIVREATERWRIPAEVVEADPADHQAWRAAMLAAAARLVGG
jgi:uncharacterized protein YbjT (DUF2867 family)